jgi:hypothetical protein
MRFSAIFYLKIRELVRDAVFMMKRENKKRMMPRHLLTSAVLSGTIPRSMITEHMLDFER